MKPYDDPKDTRPEPSKQQVEEMMAELKAMRDKHAEQESEKPSI